MDTRSASALPAARGEKEKGEKEGPNEAGADRLTKIGWKSILRHFQMQQVLNQSRNTTSRCM